MIIVNDKKQKINNEIFFDAVTGKKIKERTKIYLHVRNNYLIVNFSCLDNPYVKENKFSQDNSELFKQEVFEIFIAQGITTPHNYLEIEINPLGAVFIAQISNPDMEGSDLKAKKINKLDSGIITKVSCFNNSWEGFIEIPLKLLNSSINNLGKDYRINFYRIISQKSHKEENWKNTAQDCTYSCWKSTFSPSKPQFHRSKYFGYIHIDI